MDRSDRDLDRSFDAASADSLESALAGEADGGVLPPLPVGTMLGGRFRLRSVLGRGGMGQVWAATDETTGEPVAVKVLALASPEAADRFAKEAQNAMRLQGARIVRVLDEGSHEGRPFLVMERVEGEPLSTLLARDGRLPWRRAAALAGQVLEALAEAHEHPARIVHRDIKPANLMVGEDDAVTVLDFGIARALEGAATALTRTGHVVGSPETMAPEQWELRPLTPQTDLYGLGCTVYAMLSGRPPFEAADAAALGYRHVHDQPPPLDAALAPTALRRWCARLLAKRPEERPASARVARADLDRILSPEAAPAIDTASLPPRPFRHLSPFRRADGPLLFGRDRLIAALTDTVIESPLTLVFGPSGVGKSSLLDAGLGSALAPTHDVRYARRDRTRGLVGTLEQMVERPVRDGSWARGDASPVLLLDQVEEGLFGGPEDLTGLAEVAASAFGDSAPAPAGRLVVGFRKEWLDEIESAFARVGVRFTKVAVRPLGRFDLIDAVEGVSRDPVLRSHYRIRVDDGLAERVADAVLDAGGSAELSSSIAPTLQIILAKLWDAAEPDADGWRTLTVDAFAEQQAKGLLLSDFLEAALAGIGEWRPSARSSGVTLDLLAHHTTLASTARTLHRTELESLYADRLPEVEALARRCVEAHLLVGEPTRATRLSHDTLAVAVRRRFQHSDAPGQRAARVLESRTGDWAVGDGAPLDAHDLRLVREGLPGMRALRPLERRILDASDEAERRRQRTRRGWTALGVILVALIALSSVVAWSQREAALQSAQAERRALYRSRTENLIASSARAEDQDHRRAALLAVEAWRRHREVPVGPEVEAEVERRLRAALAEDYLPADVLGFDDNAMAVAVSPDDARFAVAGGRTVEVHRLTGGLEATLRGHEALVVGVCWADAELVTVDLAGVLHRWAVDRAESVGRVELGVACHDVTCHEGAAAVAVRDGAHRWPRGADAASVLDPAPARAIAFGPDGRIWVVGGASLAALESVAGGWVRREVAAFPGEALRELDVDPAGSRALVGTARGRLFLVELDTGARRPCRPRSTRSPPWPSPTTVVSHWLPGCPNRRASPSTISPAGKSRVCFASGLGRRPSRTTAPGRCG